MSTSATDMARFMIAHLQDGRYSDENIADARILEEATAQQMHSTLFTFDPRINGLAYFFWELELERSVDHRARRRRHHAPRHDGAAARPEPGDIRGLEQ